MYSWIILNFPHRLNAHYNLSAYGSTALVGFGRFFSFLIYTQSVGLLGRGISQSQGHYLHAEYTHIETSMTWAGFEPTIPVFELAKTVHALDRAATVIGASQSLVHYLSSS
jgi:hypothetical protein